MEWNLEELFKTEEELDKLEIFEQPKLPYHLSYEEM